MGLPAEQLGRDEVQVLHLRTHVKALLVPAVVLVVTAVVSGFLFALLPADWQPAAGWIVALAMLVVLAIWVVAPFLSWFTTTYTFTNRRIITRSGILVKKGHDLPLARINNVSYRRGPIDQLLGCGTLVMTTAAEQPVTLNDIPDVERVHVVMTELLFGGEDPIRRPTLKDE
ncbi:MAG TPA: PH domain-containing protein [Propionicimonas sp.]|nr:PH domain-containing protein [Propionicimonas sp.]HQA76766.1 PH domain-containing protein [Propionicimonas sp.]